MARLLHSTQQITVNIPDGDSLVISSLKGTYSAYITTGFYAGTVLATNSSGGATFGPYINGGAIVEVKANFDSEISFDLASAFNNIPNVGAIYSFDTNGDVNGLIAPDGSIYTGGAAVPPTTNALSSSGGAIISTVDSVAASLIPLAGTIQDNIGFNAAGALVKAAPSAGGIMVTDGVQTANRVQTFNTFTQTWNNLGGFTKNIVTGSEVINLSDTFTPSTSQVAFSPDAHNLLTNDGMGSNAALTVTPTLAQLEVNAGGLNRASFHISDGTVGDAAADPQLFLKTHAVYSGTAVAGQVLTLSATTGEAEFTTLQAIDTVQTASSTGTTNIAAWGSVVLIPTLVGNMTLNYPIPAFGVGKTIKLVTVGTPNAFTITHSTGSGTITLSNGGGELTVANGALTVEAVDTLNIRQVSNSIASATLAGDFAGVVRFSATTNTNLSTVASTNTTAHGTLLTTANRVTLTSATVSGNLVVDAANGTIAIAKTGYYSVTVMLGIQSAGTSGQWGQIVKNNNTVLATSPAYSQANSAGMQVVLVYSGNFASGDLIDARVNSSDVGTIGITSYSYSVIQESGFLPVSGTTRAVVQASHTTGQSIPNAATTALTGWTEQKDTAGAFNTATGVFTAPRTADYMVSFTCGYAGFTSIANGSVSAEITGAASKGAYLPISNAAVVDSISPVLNTVVSLTSGQAITVQSFQNTGAARLLNTGANRTHLSIVEIEASY